MADETLAFSVAEATMQDWQAAMLLAKQEPAASPRPQPHPAYVRPAFVRPAPRIVPIRSASRPVKPTARHAGFVAGARSVYWLGLAAALALTLV